MWSNNKSTLPACEALLAISYSSCLLKFLTFKSSPLDSALFIASKYLVKFSFLSATSSILFLVEVSPLIALPICWKATPPATPHIAASHSSALPKCSLISLSPKDEPSSSSTPKSILPFLSLSN